MATKVNAYTVTLDLSGATWGYFTKNPVGGGFGSNYCGPKKIALARAIAHIPAGSTITVITKHRGKVIGSPVILKK